MKNEKSKFSVVTPFCTLILLFAFVLIIAMPFLSVKPKVETYTECKDEEYYSETTYYLTEKAYKKHLKETAKASNRKSAAKSEISSDGEFVIAATKTFYVYEASDEDGNITESRPLKKAEAEQFLSENSTEKEDGKLSAKAILPPNPIIRPQEPVLIGKDNESLYNLSIEMSVVAEVDGSYTVTGTSNWKNVNKNLIDQDEVAEDKSLDFIGITWGGSGALCVNDKNNDIYTYGQYWNGNSVSFTRSNSDSYRGFVWQFQEKADNSPMSFAITKLNLKKTGAKQGNETNAKMTYIHTFDKISGTVSFTASLNDLAVGLAFSATDKHWQIEIDVPGINY